MISGKKQGDKTIISHFFSDNKKPPMFLGVSEQLFLTFLFLQFIKPRCRCPVSQIPLRSESFEYDMVNRALPLRAGSDHLKIGHRVRLAGAVGAILRLHPDIERV